MYTGDSLPQPLLLFLFVSVVMELISAIISFLIGYYALKGYKSSSERGLLFLHFGFVILGVSMLLRVITTAYAIAVGREAILEFTDTVYPSVKLVAYALFALTYTYQAKITSDMKTVAPVAAAAALFPLFYDPLLELLATVLLAYVMAQSIINFALKRSSNSLLVSLGFSCMFLGHLFFLFATRDTPGRYLVGHFVNLIGFLCLLVMLVQVSKAD